MDTKLLTILFSNSLRFNEIPLLRGGIIHMVERETGDVNLLFHNHMEESYRWRYPLVQYKQIDGKAAMVCIGEGIDAVQEFFSTEKRVWTLHGHKEELRIENVWMKPFSLEVTPAPLPYRIQRWLPLNTGNYLKYIQTDSLSERISLLESILSANILSMAKGLGTRIESRISCTITDLSEPELMESKSVKMMSFDLGFKANISLPQYIGLGKQVSTGHGMIIIP